jgi:hypothetical protein
LKQYYLCKSICFFKNFIAACLGNISEQAARKNLIDDCRLCCGAQVGFAYAFCAFHDAQSTLNHV